MKKPFTLLCGTVALLCLFSLFMPIVAPRYSAQMYHPASDYTKDYFLVGDYYHARQYWSITKFVLSNYDNLHRVALSVAMALLLYWCTMSFMGERPIAVGLVASIVNLGVTGYSVAKMLSMVGGARPLVIVVILADAVLAVACAAFAISRK